MRLWHILRSRLRSLFFRTRRESDLREELQLHLERETERLEAAGLRPDAARLQALRMFGGVEPTTEACRDARGVTLLDSVVRDVRYAFRSFRRTPLGGPDDCDDGRARPRAGGRRLHDPQCLHLSRGRSAQPARAVRRRAAAIGHTETREGFTFAQYEALVRETGAFSEAFATTSEIDSWVEGRRMEGPLVTGNFFQVLGVDAARGRTLTPSDDEPAALRSSS